MLNFAVAVLLVCGVAAQLICCLGMLMAKDPFDKLHLQSPAALLGPGLIAIAISLDAGFSGAALKALIAAAFIAATNPVVCFVTARALLARDPRAADGAGFTREAGVAGAGKGT
jgi:monovalent cation/proton antiporter MnhG/PhaG subunit